MSYDLQNFYAVLGSSSFAIPLYAGFQNCPPGHSWTGLRDHFLLHLVRDGRGTVTRGSEKIQLERGQVFLFRPNELMSYTADQRSPWHYVWVGFRSVSVGEMNRKLNLELSGLVFSLEDHSRFEERVLAVVSALMSKKRGYLLEAAGWLQLAISELTLDQNERPRKDRTLSVAADELIHEAKWFVEQNYQREICVADVVRHIGLDHSYLNRRFRSVFGSTLKAYLTAIRMHRAGELIVETTIPIGAVATSVGYRSYEVFERNFRATFGRTPSTVRCETGNGRQHNSGLVNQSGNTGDITAL